MKKNALILSILLLVAAILFPANRDIRFRRISLEEGLSQSLVFSILQDSKGFMWFGTQDGLNKYDGYGFKIYRPDPENPKSISHNIIRAMHEERSGVLWIGTQAGGLNMFDREKEEFIHFRYQPNDNSSLSNDFVTVIFEDRSGVLWVGTALGLNRYHPETGTFTRYQNISSDPTSLSANYINALYQDRSGVLWIGTAGGGFNKFNPENGTFTRYLREPGNENTLSNNTVTALLEDHSGEFWVATTDGLNRFDREAGSYSVYRFEPDNPYSLSESNISTLCEDHANMLWVGTPSAGLNTFDRRTERFYHYRWDPNKPTGLSTDIINTIYEDSSDILWIGTGAGGINRFDRETEKFKRYSTIPNDPGSLSNQFVYSFSESRSGDMWIATFGGGLNKFDRGTEHFTHYRAAAPGTNAENRLCSDYVYFVMEDKNGILWIGTNGAGLDRFDTETETFKNFRAGPTGLSNNAVRVIRQDTDGFLWLGTLGGGINKFDPKSEKFKVYANNPHDTNSLGNDAIQNIFIDRDGIMWVSTAGAGLDRFDPNTERFTHYRTDLSNPHSLGSDIIMSVYQDSSGTIWVGTFGGGLNRFNPENETFTHFREKDGLPNDAVYGILEADDGCLWLSTNMGLSKFNPGTRAFKNYTSRDGLQCNEFNGTSYYKTRNGEMFFGGIEGFNAFDPRDITENDNIPPVVITSFHIFNKPVSIGDGSPLKKHISETREICLSYKQNVFSFNFVALDYTIPEKNQYKYMLEDFDKDWIFTDASRRFAGYTNIDPGEYIFRVKGSNNDGVWNEEGASIKIIITPPLWQTWWFRIIAAFLALMLGVLFYRGRMKRISRKTRLEAELMAARAAQMSIMPQTDPRLKGFYVSGICVPAYEVGGDFFDYFWMNREKTKFGIAIGDVSGKAMKAAMTAVMSSGMIYSRIYCVDSVKDMMTQVNHPLYLKTDKKMFTALCLVSLDINTKEFVFTNAGLSEPLLKSQNSTVYMESVGPRLPLGSFKHNVYQETKIILKPQDVVVLFTDGIPEARNNAGEFYGYDALKNLVAGMNTDSLSATEIKERIIADIARFTRNMPQHDDMTLVVVKYR